MSKEQTIINKLSHVPYHVVKKLCSGKSVLDAACGDGSTSKLLESFGATKVTGVDLNVELIAGANSRNHSHNVKFYVANVEQLEQFFDSEKFDVIVSSQTIEHIVDVDAFVFSLKLLLNENGTIVISCPNESILGEDISIDSHHSKFCYDSFVSKLSSILEMPYVVIGSYPTVGVISLAFSDDQEQDFSESNISKIISARGLHKSETMLFTAVFSKKLNFEQFIDLDVYSFVSWNKLINYDYLHDLKKDRELFELKQRSLIIEALKVEVEILEKTRWQLHNECEKYRIECEKYRSECEKYRSECEYFKHLNNVYQSQMQSLKFCIKRCAKVLLKKILPLKIINFMKKP